MYQPYPPSGQPAGPLRPPAPAPVRTAVKLMYAGAAVWTVILIGTLVLIIGDSKAVHAAVNGHILTAAQASQQKPLLISVAVVFGLAVIGLWLWMARAAGQRRNWARTVSTVLSGLATLQLISPPTGRQPVSDAGVGVVVLGVIAPVLGWLAGLAAVWLLWRPASSAFFKTQGFTRAGSGAQLAARIRSSRNRLPRQWWAVLIPTGRAMPRMRTLRCGQPSANVEVPQIFRTGDPIGFSPERNGIKCRENRSITLRSSRSRPSGKWSTPRRRGQLPKWRGNSALTIPRSGSG